MALSDRTRINAPSGLSSSIRYCVCGASSETISAVTTPSVEANAMLLPTEAPAGRSRLDRVAPSVSEMTS